MNHHSMTTWNSNIYHLNLMDSNKRRCYSPDTTYNQVITPTITGQSITTGLTCESVLPTKPLNKSSSLHCLKALNNPSKKDMLSLFGFRNTKLRRSFSLKLLNTRYFEDTEIFVECNPIDEDMVIAEVEGC